MAAATSQRDDLGEGVAGSVSAASSQQVCGHDAFQVHTGIRSTPSLQPTRSTAEPRAAPGLSSPPELQSLHISRINYLTTPQESIFRTC